MRLLGHGGLGSGIVKVITCTEEKPCRKTDYRLRSV